MTEKPDTVNDERVQAAVERVARVLADAVCLDIDECIGSEDCGCDHAAREALAALRPGDVLPGDGSGRLVVVREVADRPPVPTATPGRYAKCIDNNGSKIRLTIGKTYEVVEERLDAFGHFYRVLNDMNREEDFRAARFEPIAKEMPHD
mgnify:CR=1 FL=1